MPAINTRAIGATSNETPSGEGDRAEMAVRNARGLLSDFEEVETEVKYGSIKHAIEELRNARRALSDDY